MPNSGFLTERTNRTLPPPNEIGQQRTPDGPKTKKVKENAPVPNSGSRTERSQLTLPPPNEIGLQRTDPSNDLAALLLPEQPPGPSGRSRCAPDADHRQTLAPPKAGRREEAPVQTRPRSARRGGSHAGFPENGRGAPAPLRTAGSRNPPLSDVSNRGPTRPRNPGSGGRTERYEVRTTRIEGAERFGGRRAPRTR